MRLLIERLAHDERGAMTVLVLGFLPVAIALAAFVIDAANGFEHKRHLQLQADAGVLAAAQEMTRCLTDPAGANAAITAQASAYSGAVNNAQVGGPLAQARVRTVLNGTGYDAASGSDGLPCDTGFIDLKLTEGDSPALFPFISPFDVRAHARVEALRLQTSERLLPIAAEDPIPRSAKAIFVNEATGEVLATTPLKSNGSDGGLSIFDNSAAPLAVPITAEHVGVRIALSGKASVGACGDTLVACYDMGSSNGLLHIRGWSAAGSVTNAAPLARGVTLKQGTCTDPYFSASASDCAVAVDATVQFGAPAADAKLWATVGRNRYAMSYDPTVGSWTSGAVVPVAAASGPVAIGLDWEQTSGTVGSSTCKKQGSNPCTGSLGTVQRSFSAAPDRSGPIELAQVLSGSTAGANSLERCSSVQTSCTYGLVVRIGIEGTLDLSTVNGPPVRLRVVHESSGSQTQSLQCNPSPSNLKEELAEGCTPAYTRNEGTDCPTSANTLWGSAQPWPCVAVQTGTAANSIAEGLNTRILGEAKPASCTAPNKWPDVRNGDPRIVYVIVTPFGSFTGNGSTTVPVIRIAAFYITGWTGQGGGFQNPCLNQGDERPRDSAEIVGRFIKYVETPNTGDTSDEHCDFDAVDVCAAVLVQ